MDENMNGNQQNGMNAGQPDGAAQNMNPNQQAYGGQQYYDPNQQAYGGQNKNKPNNKKKEIHHEWCKCDHKPVIYKVCKYVCNTVNKSKSHKCK